MLSRVSPVVEKSLLDHTDVRAVKFGDLLSQAIGNTEVEHALVAGDNTAGSLYEASIT